MKITKYGHACFTVEREGQFLVVDPGSLSPDFVVPENVVAIVITHEHADHFDPDKLAAIYNKNPNSLLLADESVTTKMPDHKSQAVSVGDQITVGAFQLEFFGGKHATVYQDTPQLVNLGVMINEQLYYPGDSLTVPNKPVDVLALPLGAPWLKTSEAIDFMLRVKPRFAFPTHDGVLSSAGQTFGDNWLKQSAEPAGIVYKRLGGEAVEI